MTHGPGMWQPKQKDGKNWIVNYTVTLDGEEHQQHRKFRVREDARIFIDNATKNLERDERVTSSNFQLSKIEK